MASSGFGFVGFDSEDVVEKLAQARFHTINGKSVSQYAYIATLNDQLLAMLLMILLPSIFHMI